MDDFGISTEDSDAIDRGNELFPLPPISDAELAKLARHEYESRVQREALAIAREMNEDAEQEITRLKAALQVYADSDYWVESQGDSIFKSLNRAGWEFAKQILDEPSLFQPMRKSGTGERWITIGSEPGADGKNHGGYPVKIDGDGRMLTGKFAGKTFDEAFEEPKKKRHFSRREDGTPTHTTKGEVFTVPTEAMYVDPARFQYKIKNIGADGVTAELKDTKVWNPELGGVLLVWRDPETGKDYVVNGHHRRELAGRSGAKELNVRYIDAPNHVEARARGALANIAEGRGTALDAAKFMRDSKKTPEQLKEAGVSMSGKVAADAAVLVGLNEKSFQALTQGMLDEDKAVAVAKYLPDQALQQKLFKKLETREEDGKEWSIKEIETAARKMANAGKLVTQGTDLFGDFESEDSTFDQEVEIEAYVRRQLAQDANDFKAVASERRAERVASAGNVLATDENASRHKAAEVAASEFDRESGLKGPVTATIQEFAAKLAKATKKSEKAAVKQEAYDALRKVIGAAA